MADNLADLWRDHRAKTHYQDGLAAAERAETMYALAQDVHAFVVGRPTRVSVGRTDAESRKI